MSTYRIYFLGEDGHIRDVEAFQCNTDLDAIGLADNHAERGARELWNLDRLVRHYPPSEARAGQASRS